MQNSAKKHLYPSRKGATTPLTSRMGFWCIRCETAFPCGGEVGCVALFPRGGGFAFGVSCVDCLSEDEWDLMMRGEDLYVTLPSEATTTG